MAQWRSLRGQWGPMGTHWGVSEPQWGTQWGSLKLSGVSPQMYINPAISHVLCY